jgi:hypothetical protein
VAILDGEAELNRLNDTPRELEYQASEAAKRDQVANGFGVPTALVDVSVIRANSREAKNAHIEGTVWPYVQLVEDTWNMKLTPRWGEGLFIVHENPIPDDESIRVAERQSKLSSGWTPNELRVEEGVEPLDDPGADEAYLPSTLVPMRAGGLRLDSDLAAAEAAMGDGEGMDAEPVPEEMSTAEVPPEQVLSGQQIAAALALVQAVIDEKIPIDSARGQLVVLYNLDEAQANTILAGVEGFEKPEPEVPPMLPGQPPPGEPVDADSGDSSAPAPPERRILDLQRDINALWAKYASLGLQLEAKAAENGRTEPVIHVTNVLPDQSHMINVQTPALKMPELPAPVTNVVVEQPDVGVHMDAPITNVTVEPSEAPIVTVAPPDVDVQVQPPDVYVEAPHVAVDGANVEVSVPDQPAPIVNVTNETTVEQPAVKVEPHIEVNISDDDDG